jgi:hypothetical protein
MVFFDPRKWNPVEKRLLLGGFVGSLSYWTEQLAQIYVPQIPKELKSRLEEHLPTNGELVIGLAPPAALYLVGKVSKSTATKEKLSDLTLGSALYCLPNITHKTVCRVALVEGTKAVPARLTAPTPVARYTQTTTPTRTVVAPTVGKYRLTA